MTFLGNLLQAVKPSPTLAITGLAGEMRRSGIDVIGLSQGEPDFPTPDPICAAGKAAIDAGATKYTDVDGTLELKQAIARKFERDNQLRYKPAQISVGTGGKQVIFNALIKQGPLRGQQAPGLRRASPVAPRGCQPPGRPKRRPSRRTERAVSFAVERLALHLSW